jgi:hypothetical protein
MDERNDTRDEFARITLAYVQGLERGTGPSIEELARAYPQYASDLVAFATDYYITEEIGDDDAQVIDDLSAEREVLSQAFEQLRYPPTLTNLMARAREQGFPTAVALGNELDLGVDVVAKLDQRVIIVDDGLEFIFEPLARLLAVSVQRLREFFSGQSTMALQASFYASAPPVVERRQTLADAIRSSLVMTAEQKSKWLTLMGEPLPRPEEQQRPSRRAKRKG